MPQTSARSPPTVSHIVERRHPEIVAFDGRGFEPSRSSRPREGDAEAEQRSLGRLLLVDREFRLVGQREAFVPVVVRREPVANVLECGAGLDALAHRLERDPGEPDRVFARGQIRPGPRR